MEHFQVFGCVAYAHIQKENWEKLDEKGKNIFLVGIVISQKAIESKKLIISRDVIFDKAI